MQSYLKDLYYNLDNPESYSSINKVFRAGKTKFPKLKKKDVELWFQKQPTATMHKRVRFKFPRNKTIVMSLGDQIQVDLCDMRNIAKYNNDYNYLLTGIDCFDRTGFGEKVKNKSGKEITRALKIIFKKRAFHRMQTDKGREFLNSNVKQLLKDSNTELWISENDDVKAALVERFNRTLKDRMYKYFTANNTKRWIDMMPRLVDGYNNSYHRTIKMRPVNVKNQHQNTIRRILYPPDIPTKAFQLNIGDLVRISKARKSFRKGYLPNWSTELFKIISRFSRTRPVYEIEDLNGTKIKGTFYTEELVKTEMPDEFLIEKIIRKKRERNGQTKYLVKWTGYDSSFNSWIDDSQIRNL